MKSTFCWGDQHKTASVGFKNTTMERPFSAYFHSYFAIFWVSRVIAPVFPLFVFLSAFWVHRIVLTLYYATDHQRQFLSSSL
jgi:hypothetical protein